MNRKLFFAVLLLAATACLSAEAQRRPRVRVEWGVLGGLNVLDYATSDSKFDIENKLGWQLGITTAIDFGAVAIEPQILYMRQGLRVRPEGERQVNLRSNSIDVPVFASLRLLRPVRIYAGPVFTVMNDCRQKSGGDLLAFGRIRPSVSFSAGVGVLLLRHMLVDVRYNGQFKGKDDVMIPLSGGGEAHIGRLRSHSFSINFGYIF